MAADSKPGSNDLQAAVAVGVQYVLAYGVALPIFVIHGVARRLRRSPNTALPPQPP